jgi:hypothetical protein
MGVCRAIELINEQDIPQLGTWNTLCAAHQPCRAGLMLKDSMGPGRILGYYGTQGLLLTLAGYTAYLVKDFLQIAA